MLIQIRIIIQANVALKWHNDRSFSKTCEGAWQIIYNVNVLSLLWLNNGEMIIKVIIKIAIIIEQDWKVWLFTADLFPFSASNEKKSSWKLRGW